MLRRFNSTKARNRILAAAAGGVAVSLLGAGSASAATFTFNKTAAGAYDWDDIANWNPANTGFPQNAGDVANVNNNIAGDVTINLNTDITLGTLLLGDSTSTFFPFTIDAGTPGGSLIFDTGSESAATFRSSNINNIVNADIQLISDLNMDVRHGTSNSTLTLTVNGSVTSGAASGVQTLNLRGSMSTYGGVSRWNGAIADGNAGGRIALRQWTGTATLAGNNDFTGSTSIYGGTLRGVQTGGTPFGRGNIIHQRGTLHLLPDPVDENADITLSGANTQPDTTYTYTGGATLSLDRNTNASVTLTLGNALAGSDSVLQRGGRGVLAIQTSGGGVLGSNERVIVQGGVPVLPQGIVNPSIVGLNGSTADFLTYSGSDGLVNATYTNRSGAFTADPDEITNITGSATVSTSNPYALRVHGGTLTIGNDQTLTVGNGTGQAGVILNARTIQGGNSGSLLQFNGAEAVVYVAGNSTISARMAGTGGLTKSGSAELTLSGDNSGLSGDLYIQQGRVNVNGGASLGETTVHMFPGTSLRPANGLTIDNDIVVTGGVKPGTSVTDNNAWFRPQITTTGSGSMNNPATLSGTISSSGLDEDVYGVGAVYFNLAGGAIRLTGDNTFAGPLRMNQGLLLIANSNALGAADGTSATSTSQYTSSTLGLENNVVITNELLNLATQQATGTNYGNLHAFGEGGTWNGPVSWAGSIRVPFGAEEGARLKFGAPNTLTGTVNGFIKVGEGVVEIAAPQTLGSGAAASTTTAYVEVRAGTLLLTNTTGSAVGDDGLRVVGGTLAGTGSVSHSVYVLGGAALSPGDPTQADSIGTFTLSGTSTRNLTGTNFANGATFAAELMNAARGSLETAPDAIVVLELSSTAADSIQLLAADRFAYLHDAISYSILGDSFSPAGGTVFDLIVADSITYQGISSGDIPLDSDNLDSLLASYGYTTRVLGADPVDAIGSYRYSIVTDAVDIGGGQLRDALRLELAAVPEPGSLSVLSIGALGLLRRRRRV